jgi:hypothetical protein
MRIAILTPTRGFPRWKHVICRDTLLIHTLTTPIIYNQRPTVPEVWSCGIEGAYVADNRNQLAEQAIARDADYLLWLDDDMIFPSDSFFRLALHDLPIVGCNYRQRIVEEVIPSAFNLVDGEVQRLQPKPEGLEQVDVIGLGVCLMKAHHLRQLPRPWFRMGADGEDGHICGLFRAEGMRPVVDHGLSAEVRHVAEIDLAL